MLWLNFLLFYSHRREKHQEMFFWVKWKFTHVSIADTISLIDPTLRHFRPRWLWAAFLVFQRPSTCQTNCQAKARMTAPVWLLLRMSLALALATSLARAEVQTTELAREVRLDWEARDGQLFFALVSRSSSSGRLVSLLPYNRGL